MSWLIAFLALFVVDVCWAFYVSAAGAGAPVKAGMWAVALFVLGAVAVIGYTHNPVLVFPSALGAFAGTSAGVYLSKRKLDMDSIWTWLAWRLPRRLVYWCAVRLMAHAGEVFAKQEVPTITCMQALVAWDEEASAA